MQAKSFSLCPSRARGAYGEHRIPHEGTANPPRGNGRPPTRGRLRPHKGTQTILRHAAGKAQGNRKRKESPIYPWATTTVFPAHANVLFLKEARPIPDTPKTLASGMPFGPKSMSESRRNIQWMETPKRNHAHANLHGWARELAWLDFATCMVQLAEVHGSASSVAWLD